MKGHRSPQNRARLLNHETEDAKSAEKVRAGDKTSLSDRKDNLSEVSKTSVAFSSTLLVLLIT